MVEVPVEFEPTKGNKQRGLVTAWKMNIGRMLDIAEFKHEKEWGHLYIQPSFEWFTGISNRRISIVLTFVAAAFFGGLLSELGKNASEFIWG